MLTKFWIIYKLFKFNYLNIGEVQMEPKLNHQVGISRNSIPENNVLRQVEEFEDKLREDNLKLFNQFRLKDLIVKENAQVPKL